MELSNIQGGPYLVVIVGPTAVGKTQLAIDLATTFDAQIISADSRQCYRELNIGTAKPTASQLDEVKHHFINSHSIHDLFNAGMYADEVMALLPQLFEKRPLAIMVGGSGMYIDAVLKGFDHIPEVPQNVRARFNQLLEQKGLAYLSDLLMERDPEYYGAVDQSNSQRVIRALEVIEYTGQKFSSFLNSQGRQHSFKVIEIGLDMDREQLYHRIDLRMDNMIANGLFEEAQALFEHRDLYALQTVGYSEIFDHIEGKYDREEAIRLLKRNSRRYAKRQLTWFKRDQDIIWFSPKEDGAIINTINSFISSAGKL